jgi:hypothetical protein
VRDEDEFQFARIEDLGDGLFDGVVDLICAGMDQGGAVVGNKELVERDLVFGGEGRYAVDAVVDFVDSCVHGKSLDCRLAG